MHSPSRLLAQGCSHQHVVDVFLECPACCAPLVKHTMLGRQEAGGHRMNLVFAWMPNEAHTSPLTRRRRLCGAARQGARCLTPLGQDTRACQMRHSWVDIPPTCHTHRISATAAYHEVASLLRCRDMGANLKAPMAFQPYVPPLALRSVADLVSQRTLWGHRMGVKAASA